MVLKHWLKSHGISCISQPNNFYKKPALACTRGEFALLVSGQLSFVLSFRGEFPLSVVTNRFEMRCHKGNCSYCIAKSVLAPFSAMNFQNGNILTCFNLRSVFIFFKTAAESLFACVSSFASSTYTFISDSFSSCIVCSC